MGMGGEWDGMISSLKAWFSVHQDEGKDVMCLCACFPRQPVSQRDHRPTEVEPG